MYRFALVFWLRHLLVVWLIMLSSLLFYSFASDWTDSNDFSYQMQKSMEAVETKMIATEDCYRAIETRNELLCTIWKRNVYEPFTWFH